METRKGKRSHALKSNHAGEQTTVAILKTFSLLFHTTKTEKMSISVYVEILNAFSSLLPYFQTKMSAEFYFSITSVCATFSGFAEDITEDGQINLTISSKAFGLHQSEPKLISNIWTWIPTQSTAFSGIQ